MGLGSSSNKGNVHGYVNGSNEQFGSQISTSQVDPVVTEEHTKEISRLRYLNTSLMDENDVLRKRNSEEIPRVERQKQPFMEEDSLLKQSEAELQEERDRNEKLIKMIQNKHKEDIERHTDEGNKVRNKYLEEISTLQEEKNSLLTRLSAVAGAKLMDGNADIADLSDENRPTKLAEQYSELYDNEWLEAFDVLTSGGKRTEESAIHILANAFCVAYRTCAEKAMSDLRSLTLSMKTYYGRDNIPIELLKQLKDERKKSFGDHMASLIQIFKTNSKAIFADDPARKTPQINTFLLKSLEICWLMAVQNPQVYVDVNIQCKGDKLDTYKYRTYTRTGSNIDFVVWPALYIQQGGGLLLKGVAQGTATRDKVHGEPEQTQTQEVNKRFSASGNSSYGLGTSHGSSSINLKTWQNMAQPNESQTQNQGNMNASLTAPHRQNVTKVSIHI